MGLVGRHALVTTLSPSSRGQGSHAPAARSGTVYCIRGRTGPAAGSPNRCLTVFKQLGGPRAATLAFCRPCNSGTKGRFCLSPGHRRRLVMDKMDLAALLALSSALLVAVGDVLQQRASHRLADISVGGVELFVRLLGNRRWRWGALLLVASIVLQAAALDQGSVLLVQALLVLSLLFALPISARLAHRAVTGREWFWGLMLTAAVTVIVTVGNPQAGHSTASLRTWAPVMLVFGPLLLGCVVAARIWGGALAAVLFAFVSGSLWGIFAVLTKGVVHRLGEGGWSAARTPELYAWLLAALGGFAWEQSAFRAGALTASMPTLEVAQPVVAALLGVVVLGETLNTGHAGMIALAVAALVMTVATFELARGDAVATRDRVDAARSDTVGQPA